MILPADSSELAERVANPANSVKKMLKNINASRNGSRIFLTSPELDDFGTVPIRPLSGPRTARKIWAPCRRFSQGRSESRAINQAARIAEGGRSFIPRASSSAPRPRKKKSPPVSHHLYD